MFDEALDETESRLPAASRFTIETAAGDEIEIGAVAVSGMTVTVNLHADSPRIRSGQTVTVAYTDRTSGDDGSGVVQDDDGNDAADFTTGENSVAAVTNGSDQKITNPGAPRNLATRPGGADSIVVSWDPPADTGGVAITAYWVYVSIDGMTFPLEEGFFFEIEDIDPGTGRVVTEFTHTHTDLASGALRYYRVAALNAPARAGPYSGIVTGRAVEPRGPGERGVRPGGGERGRRHRDGGGDGGDGRGRAAGVGLRADRGGGDGGRDGGGAGRLYGAGQDSGPSGAGTSGGRRWTAIGAGWRRRGWRWSWSTT